MKRKLSERRASITARNNAFHSWWQKRVQSAEPINPYEGELAAWKAAWQASARRRRK